MTLPRLASKTYTQPTSTMSFTAVAKPSAVPQIAYVPPAVTSLNMPSSQPAGWNSLATPPATPPTGMTYVEPAKVSAAAEMAAKLMTFPTMSMPIMTGGTKQPVNTGITPGGSGTSRLKPDATAAAAIAAAAAAGGGSEPATSGGGGGGGGGGEGGDDPPQYVDQGPSTDDSGAYYDPTWDDATTPAPLPTAGIVAASTTPAVPTNATLSTPPAVAPTAPVMSFWKRLLFLFGMGGEAPPAAQVTTAPKPAAAAVHGDPNSVEEVAASLVRRSRLGDQNATAMLCEIRDNAKRGSAKALRSQKLILAYIDKNPVRDDVEVGEELRITVTHDDMVTVIEHGQCACDKTLATAVSLSQGPPLTNTSIQKYMARFGGEMQRAVIHGMLNPRRVPHHALKDHLKEAHGVGRAIGAARRLQAIRAGAPFSTLDPVIGWEMGEEG